MHRIGFLFGPRAVFFFFGLSLGGLALACGPAASQAPTPTLPDPFAVVRATSQAAYRQGRTALDQGDVQRGCPSIDTAKTNDPDNNPDIQRALDQCLTQIPQFLATAEAASAPTPAQRTIIVATLPIVPATQPTQAANAVPTAPAVSAQAASASSQPARTTAVTPTAVAAAANMATYRDAQGRFSVAAPPEWSRVDQPIALFGTGVVQLRDPGGRAEFDVAVDTNTKAVSPELYAASMEIAMQQQVPGYAAEQMQPVSVTGTPAIRRVFTYTQRDASGADMQARAVQSVVLKGQTPYILSGSAPAEQFAQYRAIFDQMVESFRFS